MPNSSRLNNSFGPAGSPLPLLALPAVAELAAATGWFLPNQQSMSHRYSWLARASWRPLPGRTVRRKSPNVPDQCCARWNLLYALKASTKLSPPRCELPLGLSDCIEPPSIIYFSCAIRSLVGVHRHAVHSVRSPVLLITVRQRLIHNVTCSHRTKSRVMRDWQLAELSWTARGIAHLTGWRADHDSLITPFEHILQCDSFLRSHGRTRTKRPTALSGCGQVTIVNSGGVQAAAVTGFTRSMPSASRTTSSTRSQNTNSTSSRTTLGTSSKSLRLRAGSSTLRMPARCAATVFSLTPPIGNTRPRKLISPVIARLWATVRFVNSDTSDVYMATPALGP